MKTCEEYVLKKFLESEAVIAEKNKKIEELNDEIFKLKNPTIDDVIDDKKIDCITLQKSSNIIYRLRTNTSVHDYKEKFGSSIANGKITLDEMKKALEDDKALDELNDKVVLNRWIYNEKMYQFEPYTADVFEFTINGIQYLIYGNYDNLDLVRLNDLDRSDGFFYESYREECLKHARENARKTLKNTIEVLEEKTDEI